MDFGTKDGPRVQPSKGISLREFIRRLGLKKHTDIPVAFAYYREKYCRSQCVYSGRQGEFLRRLLICWQISCHCSLNRSCQLTKSLVVSGLKIRSSGRIRTYDQSVNSRPLYH